MTLLTLATGPTEQRLPTADTQQFIFKKTKLIALVHAKEEAFIFMRKTARYLFALILTLLMLLACVLTAFAVGSVGTAEFELSDSECSDKLSPETWLNGGDKARYVCSTDEDCAFNEEIPRRLTCSDSALYNSKSSGDLSGADRYSGACVREATDPCADGHTLTTVGAIEPTCTEAGYTGDQVCSVCHKTITKGEEIPASGHIPITIPAVEPTCTGTGLTVGVRCVICEQVLTAQKVIEAKGHTIVTDAAVAPTCSTAGLTEGSHCSVCNAVLTKQGTLPALGHSFAYTPEGNGTHWKSCTRCDEEALEDCTYVDGICASCGATTSNVVNVTFRHSLSLQSDISVNFVILKSELAAYDKIYLEYTIPVYNGNEQTGMKTATVQPVENGSYYYFTVDGINAVNIGTTITATIHMEKDGKAYNTNNDTYSVAMYAYNKLASATATDALKAACANLLRYGSSAQTYKGFRTNALADEKMTVEQKAYLTNLDTVTCSNSYKVYADVADPSVTWVGKMLVMDSKVTIKVVINATKFAGDLNALTLRGTYVNHKGVCVSFEIPNGAMAAYGAKSGYYSFEINFLLASEMRNIVNVAVYAGNTQVSVSMDYSIESYAVGKSGALQLLCKAMLAYSDAAKAMFS